MKNKDITIRDLYNYLRDEWEYRDEKALFPLPFNGGTYLDKDGNVWTNIVSLGSLDKVGVEELEKHYFEEAIWYLKNEPDDKYIITLNIMNFMENAIKKILDKHCGGRI